MNLFRSEEDVKGWSGYDPISEEAILPVADWAYVFSSPLFRNRLEPDILARNRELAPDFYRRLAKFGRAGNFWIPERH